MASFSQLRQQARLAATSGGSAAVTSLANIAAELCQRCEDLERRATTARVKVRRAKSAALEGCPEPG